MGKNNYFQFKQFRIEQQNSGMKVGVDGVLLGAWAKVENCSRILDVGTGTGLIALMMAQRSDALITGVEMEENAANEAKLNVSKSPWKDRVEIRYTSFQQFANSATLQFDLIVSNPPFFSRATRAASFQRTLARHNDTLPFSELITCSSRLLEEAGRLALILPVEAKEEIIHLASGNGLAMQRICEIKPKPGKKANRLLLELGKKETVPQKDCLVIYNDDGSFTEPYIALTKNFYLKF